MRRRDFMAVLAGAAAYPLLAGAQQRAMPVIGYISGAGPSGPLRAAFQQGLGETGYVDGTTSLGVDDQPDVVLNMSLRHDSRTEPTSTHRLRSDKLAMGAQPQQSRLSSSPGTRP